jgi:hypothetical protein
VVRSLGIDVDPEAMVDRIVAAGSVDSEVGLHYRDGSELAGFLREKFGLGATDYWEVDFAWVAARAG